MLNWVVIFFVLAVVSGILGFGGLAASAAYFARILFYAFLAALAVSIAIKVIKGEPLL